MQPELLSWAFVMTLCICLIVTTPIQSKWFGWFSNNAHTRSLLSTVTTGDFHPEALLLSSLTFPVDSNLAINLQTLKISVKLGQKHQPSEDFKITATFKCCNLLCDYHFTRYSFLSKFWTTCRLKGDITSIILIIFSYD